jgi:hypothetical protein
MKDFMVIFRESDGRMDIHSAEDNVLHQAKVNSRMESLAQCIELHQATELIKNCPILEHGGFAEVREVM